MKLSRRNFLKATGIIGGGLVIGVALTSGDDPLPIEQIEGAFVPDAFLQITPDNNIRFYFPRDEMGQGAMMGLATIVAEELDVHPHNLDVKFAGVHSDYNNPEFKVQGTGGSTSIRRHYYPLRESAAKVRAMVLAAAARELNVAVGQLKTDDAHVIYNEQRYPYGQFVGVAKEMSAPSKVELKKRDQFKYIGSEVIRIDALEKSTGTAVYGIDVDIPNMHYAVVSRSPVAGGKPVAYQKEAVLALPGVTDVVEIDSGVAVVAERYWQAKTAAGKLQIEWDSPAESVVDTSQIKADYQRALAERDATDYVDDGSLNKGFEKAAHTVEAQYWAPYLAHAPLEPMNAVVNIEGDQADLWAGTQAPAAAQGLVSRYAKVPIDNVTVHSTYLGGGFGRRAFLNYVVEATQTAAQTAKPIKLIWSREDDMRHSFYRPASLMRIKAGVDNQGILSAWHATRVGANVSPDTLKAALPGVMPAVVSTGVTDWMASTAESVMDGWFVDYTSVEGLDVDYDHRNIKVDHISENHGLPTAFWRSVGHSYTAFAKETIIDELAEKNDQNEIDFRLANTKNDPRINQVIKAVAERANELDLPEGHYIGFAAHGSFMSYVAQAAEVSVENNKIVVHRMLCAIDCGQVINPDIVRAQMEGSIMFGLTAALHGQLDLVGGAIKQSNFHDYPILRMNEAPEVEVIIVESSEDPSGVGEPGVPPVAPAVANAVYKAVGQRLRELPLKIA